MAYKPCMNTLFLLFLVLILIWVSLIRPNKL